MQKPEATVRSFRFDLTGILKLLCYTILFSVAAAAAAEQKTISQHGVSITYDTTMFSKVEVIEGQARQKEIVASWPAAVAFGFDFKAFRQNAKTLYGQIAVRATEDRAVKDFDASYPDFRRLISKFAEALRQRPKLPRHTIYSPRDVPTTTGEGAGYFFLSKLRYFDFQWGSALGFLGQYSQDGTATRYAVGSRLDYKIQGVTHDDKLVVNAFFPVDHPDLPKTKKDEILDEINGKKPTDEEFDKYLRKMEKFLDRKRDDSFRPSLTVIQKLVASVRISHADPAGWSSQFTGKTIVIQTGETDAKP